MTSFKTKDKKIQGPRTVPGRQEVLKEWRKGYGRHRNQLEGAPTPLGQAEHQIEIGNRGSYLHKLINEQREIW